MSVLQEILTWSEELPDWQSDAIARLFTKQNLDADGINHLYALLKSENGIPDPQGRIANRLCADQISIPAHAGTHVELLSIKNLVRVNALANDQKLSFGAKGLTVIYGDNGSGKSGYSRVLKQACRARDQQEPILPNAHLPPETGRAEASFEINVDGIVREEKWVDGIPANEILSSIAIFDHRCARAYIDDEDDFSYIPYGLDIFEGLAFVCSQLKEKIEQEIEECKVNPSEFEDLHGSSAVGRLIENLSSDTKLADVEGLARIEPDDNQKRDSMYRSLNIEKPLENAELLRRTSQRFLRIANNFDEFFLSANDLELARYSDLDQKLLSAKSASELAKGKFNECGNLLSGTGGDAWRELFEAARKFSDEAYPGKLFPHVSNGARCLLCQQPLDSGAPRLLQFEEFIQQETEQTVRIRQKEVDEAKQVFFAKRFPVGLDVETIAEIVLYNKALADECQEFERQLTERYEQILSAFTTHAWSRIVKIPENPSIKLKLLATKLNKEAVVYFEAAQTSTRKTLEEKLNELDAKIRFSPRKNAVLVAIEKMRRQKILENCLSCVRTNAISLKAKEIAEKIITRDLAEALNREFLQLGVSNLNVELKSRSERGKPLFKLRLNLSQSANPSNILSEGEQRAVAISSFLAEVNLNGGSCGIIFDDPVSSLDHRRRDRVAKRLSLEASRRQVIVFTHDVYFLCVLNEEADKTNIPIETRSLVSKSHRFGIPEIGNPFIGMNTKDRVKFLRRQQEEIVKILKDGDEPECRRRIKEAYGDLRSSWERAVEEVLFRQVVLRFRRGIETNRLREVLVEDDDFAQIEKGMDKCSKVTNAHDSASAIGNNVPDPEELLGDIATLETWRSSIERRCAVVRERRK